MKTIKTFNWMLMAALAFGLSMGVTSCSSDDDDNKDPDPADNNDPYEKDSEAGLACYNLLSILSSVDGDLPDNWKNGATYEPIVGMVLDSSQPFVRTVVVDDLASAADYYNNLTSKSINSSAKSDVWKIDNVGTLTYTATNLADCFATIDVNVKLLPKLTQLRLVPQSAIPTNAAFDGEPWYRYGDVVCDADNCYWICVSPCYQPKGIDVSYWVSFQPNKESFKAHSNPGINEQQVPNKLGSGKSYMCYAAQLLSVLTNPNGFQQSVGSANFNGDKGFADLPVNAMSNEEIVKVAQYWEQDGVWDKVKPTNMSTADFKSYFSKSLNMVWHNSHITGAQLGLEVARFSDAGNFYRNTPSYDEPKMNMSEVKFDIREYFTKGSSNNSAVGNQALVVRIKNGKTLAKLLQPFQVAKPTEQLENVRDIYRFNAK